MINLFDKTGKILFYAFLFVALPFVFSSCLGAQSKAVKLSAREFSSQLEKTPEAILLDVRTPEEFSKGHLKSALNYNFNDAKFEEQVAGLDRSKPVFVYCLSGGRSNSAAGLLSKKGFTSVYDMAGGIMKWRAAGLPEAKNRSALNGMNLDDFNKLLVSDKLVLIDFYADWCAPCKKMKPYLEEISKEKATEVVVIRINADDHQLLCKELKIDALPVLQLYKAGNMVWNHSGFIEKAQVVNQIQSK
ncbi:MAG: thioredoxin [Saprospiraceae bacterium]|nr:thioredoxin [Saprospiraceae bacterium]